jgi:hypothetical protein
MHMPPYLMNKDHTFKTGVWPAASGVFSFDLPSEHLEKYAQRSVCVWRERLFDM